MDSLQGNLFDENTTNIEKILSTRHIDEVSNVLGCVNFFIKYQVINMILMKVCMKFYFNHQVINMILMKESVAA